MRNSILIFMYSVFAFSAFGQNNFLYRIHDAKTEYFELGVPAGYINSDGDTIIALGKYYHCYTDTLKSFAIVMTHSHRCIAINANEEEIFELLWCDNGPDIPQEGLFRIIKNGLIGYANLSGRIVISPQFGCAFPFQEGKAKVSYSCKTIPDIEHKKWVSDNWFYIDQQGRKIQDNKKETKQ